MATQILELVQREAGRVLDLVRAEMARRERDLDALREQIIRWRAALGTAAGATRAIERRPKQARKASPSRARPAVKRPQRAAARRAAVDLDGVLARLPKRFTAAELNRRLPSSAKNPRDWARAVARWTRAGKIKKNRDGSYQRA